MANQTNLDYNAISETYDTYRTYSKRVIKRILECGEIDAGMTVLDFGCGTGNVGFGIQELISLKVIGVDISFPMLRMARTKSLSVLCGDLNGKRYPFQNQSFDAIIGAYMIHQLNNVREVLAECFRILRQGRIVLLTSSHHQIEHQHPVFSQFFPSCIAIEKKRFPDISQIGSLLVATGFKDITHQEVVVEKISVDHEFIQKVKQKYVSTYSLIPHRELQRGIEQLEAFVSTRDQTQIREWRGTLLSGRKTD